jgi:hypothetical protein
MWGLPAWKILLLGACVCGAAILQERIYPLPELDDPTNRGVRWLLHAALACSRWALILLGGCAVAYAVIVLTSGL